MDVTFTDEQDLFRRTVREVLRREHPNTAIREAEASAKGYLPDLYRQLGDLGYLGLLIPEDLGGGGQTWLTTTLFFEEAGGVGLTGPYFVSFLSARALTTAGSAEQKKRLAKIATGREILTTAFAEADGSANPASIAVRAALSGDGWTLTGDKHFVPFADSADALLVSARTEAPGSVPSVGLFLVEADANGLSIEKTAFMPGERVSSVFLDGVRAEQVGEIDNGAVLENLLQEGAILEAAQAIGSSAALLEMATNYAKGRVQFGRPIGAFQGLQHMMAELATDIESSRLLVYYAAWLRDEGEPWQQMAAMARLCAANVFQHAAHTCHQIHGGYGYLLDTDVQLFVRRAKLSEVNATGSAFQRKKIATALGI